MKTTSVYSYSYFIVLWALLCLLPERMLAQQPQIEEVNIVGSFTPTIGDANKVLKNPVLPDTTISMPPLNYSIVSRPMQVSFPVYGIEARKLDAEEDAKLLKNYIKAGFGNYTTPYVEFFANKPQNKNSALGLHFRHLSSQGDIKDYAESSFAHNEIELYGKYMGANYLWKAAGSYNRHMLHHYGFKPSEHIGIINPDSIKQVFNKLRLSTGFESLGSQGDDLQHSAQFDFGYFGNNFNRSEINPSLKAGINTETRWFGFTSNEKLGLDFTAALWANKQIDSSSTVYSLAFQPHFQFIFEEYELKVGLNIAALHDTSTALHIFPVAEGSLNIVPGVLRLYGGIKGGINRYSYEKLAGLNPFLAEQVEARFSKNEFEFYGGLNTSLGRFFDFRASVSGSKLTNMPFFFNDTISHLRNTFAVVYDKGSLLRVNGEFSFHNKEKYFVVLGAAFNSYSTDSIVKAWHSPALQVYLNSKFVFKNKFVFKFRVDAAGKSFAPNYYFDPATTKWAENVPVELEGFADISLGFEYHINKRLMAFADFNNLAGKNYMRWNGVPVFGINLLAGLAYSF